MRVALISDLHGNLLALDAVLASIADAGVDRTICLGDVATLGPHPGEVLDRVRGLGEPCILGNHDEFLLDPALVHSYGGSAPVIVDAVDWCRAELSADALGFVAGFVPSLPIDLGGGASLLLFHGSPRSHMEDLLATTAPELLDVALDGCHATVMAGGHTHLQMVRQHRGVLLVNPGSVGMPIETYVAGREPKILAHAEYAIVEARAGSVQVTCHRVALDRRALRTAAAATPHPLRDALVRQYT